jgi:hypothetical protein
MAVSIGMINAIGAPLQENLNPNNEAQTGGSSTLSAHTMGSNLGVCQQLFNGSAMLTGSSTAPGQGTSELVRYNGPNCQANQVTSDTQRNWNQSTTSSETVTFTTKKWATPSTNTATANSVRTGTITYTNAAGYTSLGEPIFQAGTSRTETTALTVNGVTVSQGANEWIDGGADTASGAPAGAEYYCGDTVGYNAVANSLLNEAFGWNSQTDPNNGVRAPGANGDVTFSGTRNGTSFVGLAGFMSYKTGTPNTNCPIIAPQYTAAPTGSYSSQNFNIPVSYTFNSGFLKSLAISNATVGNYTVNAKSGPFGASNQLAVQGSITPNGSTSPIAHFIIDMNGFGALTMATGQVFTITDWHIVN